MTSNQRKKLKEIQSWYPCGFDHGEFLNSRAEYAAEETGLSYDACYSYLLELDEIEFDETFARR